MSHPEPATRGPVRLNPDVPAELERIIVKCLEKDRNLRYQHASDILTDLQRLKRDTESSRFPIPTQPQAASSHGTRSKMIIAGVLALIVMAAGSLLLFPSSVAAHGQRRSSARGLRKFYRATQSLTTLSSRRLVLPFDSRHSLMCSPRTRPRER